MDVTLKEQNFKKVRISKLPIKFVDIEETNNFDEDYLLKDLFKTIAENAPSLRQIETLQAIHFCPHTDIWPIDAMEKIKETLSEEINQSLTQSEISDLDKVLIIIYIY